MPLVVINLLNSFAIKKFFKYIIRVLSALRAKIFEGLTNCNINANQYGSLENTIFMDS